MLFGYYIHDLSPFLVKIGGFGLRWYGLAYLGGFVIGTLLYRRLAQRGFSDLKPGQVADFITMGALFGVLLGGRLGYMLFYDPVGFLHDPLLFFRVWEGGMASHGGILGLALYTLWYARKHSLSWGNLSDNLVVVAPVGLFLGRCANFINGELYGRAAEVFWAMQFPKEILFWLPGRREELLERASAIDPSFTSPEALISGVAGSPALRVLLASRLTPRYPSQIVEALLEGGLLFLLLWTLRTRVRLPDGVLTGVFLIGYAVVRILGECVREPDSAMVGPFTKGQFLSLFMILGGILLIVWAWMRPRYPRALLRAP
jgi:phosphatidylglycerol---prolipoprotein diacylglyceryl transferase